VTRKEGLAPLVVLSKWGENYVQVSVVIYNFLQFNAFSWIVWQWSFSAPHLEIPSGARALSDL